MALEQLGGEEAGMPEEDPNKLVTQLENFTVTKFVFFLGALRYIVMINGVLINSQPNVGRKVFGPGHAAPRPSSGIGRRLHGAPAPGVADSVLVFWSAPDGADGLLAAGRLP